MRFSVVITPTSTTDDLGLLLCALRFQSHRDFEVIVATDTPGMVLPARCRFVHTASAPLSVRWNQALSEVNSDVIVFLHPMLIPDPTWLSTLVREFVHSPVVAVGGRTIVASSAVAQPAHLVRDHHHRIATDVPPLWGYSYPDLDAHVTLTAWNVGFRRDALCEVGGFDPALRTPELIVSEVCQRFIQRRSTFNVVESAVVWQRSEYPVSAEQSIRDRLVLSLREAKSDVEVSRILREKLDELQDVPADSELHRTICEVFADRSLTHRVTLPISAGPQVTYHPHLPEIPEGAPRRMVFAFLATHDQPQQARELAEAGHEVHLFRPGRTSLAFVDGLWIHSIDIAFDHPEFVAWPTGDKCEYRFAYAAYQAVRELLATRFVDAVIPSSPEAGYFCLRDTGMPTIAPGSCVSMDVLDVLGVQRTRAPFDRPLTVSIITNAVYPFDAMSNISHQQANAIAQEAPRLGIGAVVRLFTLASKVDDPRVIVVPDAASLATHPHFASSDLIVFNFGFLNPLFDALHLAPRWAKIAVWYHGITPPGLMPPSQRPLLIAGYRQALLMQIVDQVFVASRFLINDLQRINVPLERIVRLPLTPSLKLSKAEPIREPGGPMRIAFLGRIQPSKGVSDLLTAFAKLRNSTRGVQLDLFANRSMSDPECIERIERFIDESGLREQVTFHFDRDNATVLESLRRSELFVMPSHHEGFCVPIIEAMSAGCFIISSDAGALPETCNGLGRLFPVGDANALLHRLQEFVDLRANDECVTESGRMSMTQWRERANAYVQSLTENHFASAFAEAVLSDLRLPSAELVRHLAREHGETLKTYREQPRIHAGSESGVIRLREQLQQEVDVAPVAVIPSPPLGWKARLRNRLRALPLVGPFCRYLKRLIYLPWNFHILFTQFQEQLQRERDRRDSA